MLNPEKIVKTFYDALEEGKVLGRKCTKCGHIEYPPYLACNACGNLETIWVELPDKVMCTQVLPVSAMFQDPDFKERVGDYCIAVIQPENGYEVGSVLLNVSSDQIDEIRKSLPLPVKPVIVQEDGFKNVHWELAEKGETMDIETRIIDCLSMAYGVDASEITLDTDIREDLSAESIRLIGFVGGIEEEFGIVIDFNDAGKLQTVRDFVDMVKELKA